MARRRNEDEPTRPYRWADTPLDPLGPSGGPRRSRWRSWLPWAVVVAVLFAAYTVNKVRESDAQTTRVQAAPRTTTTIAPTISGGSGTGPTASGPAPVGTAQSGSDQVVTVTSVSSSERSGFMGSETLLTANVSIANRGAQRLSYSALDWEIQFPDGHITSATPSMQPSELDLGGALAPGGSVSGTVSFDITGGPAGGYQIHYHPMFVVGSATQLSWAVPVG